MKRLLLIPLLLFCGCAAKPSVVPSQTDEIGFRITGALVRFDRKVDAKWNAMVQEVALDDGTFLVECFRVEDSSAVIWDRHSWPGDVEVRTMKCYLAVVEGVHWTPNGFAHLPENMDGSVKTTVGPGFNYTYQSRYETRGRIVSQSAEYMTWRITAVGHQMLVESP